MSLAAFAEGAARDEGDVLLDEQVFGKFFIRIAARRDVREDVEGAFRLEARETEFLETVVDEATAAVVFGDHLFHVLFAAAQSFDGGNLRRDGGAEHRVLMDLRHGGDEVGVAERIADAPARHGVGLGEAVQENRALLHAGQRGKRRVLHAAVGEVAVDFIGDDDEVVLFSEGGDLLKVVLRHDGARRVVRVADQKRLRALRHVRLEFLGRDAEVVFKLRGDGYGLASCKCHAGLIRDVARFGNQDFITG